MKTYRLTFALLGCSKVQGKEYKTFEEAFEDYLYYLSMFKGSTWEKSAYRESYISEFDEEQDKYVRITK